MWDEQLSIVILQVSFVYYHLTLKFGKLTDCQLEG